MSEKLVRSASTEIARAVKARNRAAEAEGRRKLAAAKLEAHIERAMAAAPPLTDEQRVRLAELLRPVHGGA